MDWNVNSVINNDWLYFFVCNRMILLTIYFNYNCWWGLKIWNSSILKNGSMFLWNNWYWNVGKLPDLDCVNLTILWGVNSFLNDKIVRGNLNWNEMLTINNYWAAWFIGDWNKVLSIDGNTDLRFNNFYLFDFVIENWSVWFWNML